MNDLNNLKEFYNHRLALNYGDDDSKETPEYWDLASENYALKAHSLKGRKEAESFLNNFDWKKGERVLDVACGPGTYAIPLALRGCKVVAVDFSEGMLNQLKKYAQKENAPKIQCIKSRWLESNFEETFNTVLCLNALGVISTSLDHQTQLGISLDKLCNLAKDRLIVSIPHADSILNNKMRSILGKTEIPLERMRIAMIYLAMVDHGMLPSLNIITNNEIKDFSSIDEAVDYLLKKGGIKEISSSIKVRFEDYLKSILQLNPDNSLRLSYKIKQAIFTVIK